MCTLKECVLCCFWMDSYKCICKVHMVYVSFKARVSLLIFWSGWTVHRCKWDIKVSNITVVLSISPHMSLIFIIFILKFLAALGLHRCTGISLVVMNGLLTAAPFFCRCEACALGYVGFSICGTQAQCCGSWPQLLMACGIFSDQGLNLCPLSWQVNS